MDNKSVSSAGGGPTSTIPRRSRHQRPKDGSGDFVDWLGEWIVSFVVFCVKSIDYTKEQVDNYWPSEESLNGIYAWIEQRPRLSSFIAIQALSIAIPVSLFLTFAFWVTLSVVSGALVVLLAGLGLGVCFFLPIILGTMFVASLVWVWLYFVWSVGAFIWTLYAGDRSQSGKIVLADQKAEEMQGPQGAGHQKSGSSGTDGSYDIPSDVQSPEVPSSTGVAFKGIFNIPPSGIAGSPGAPATPPPTTELMSAQPSSTFSGSSGVMVEGYPENSLDAPLSHAQMDELDELDFRLEKSKRMMAEMERMAPPKPGQGKKQKQKFTEKDKVMMDIERSLG